MQNFPSFKCCLKMTKPASFFHESQKKRNFNLCFYVNINHCSLYFLIDLFLKLFNIFVLFFLTFTEISVREIPLE